MFKKENLMQPYFKKISRFLAHRNLARFLGIPILLWFLSGIFMIYVSFPYLDSWERTEFSGYFSENFKLPEPIAKGSSIESILGKVVSRMNGKLPSRQLNLNSTSKDLYSVVGESFRFDGEVHTDQWTVHGRYHKLRPFFLFKNNQNTHLYVSQKTGELALVTHQWERISNYFGSVVHWIYFPFLRSKTTLWNNLIVGLSALCFCMTLAAFSRGFYFLAYGKSIEEKDIHPFGVCLVLITFMGLSLEVFV